MVTDTETGAQRKASRAASETKGATCGWYLYGITRRGPLAAVLADTSDSFRIGGVDAANAAPLQLLECSGLMAVVRRVVLADFTPDVLQVRLQSISDLEAMVRSHHHVIEAIHAEQSILPAKLGMVYSHPRDIVSALRSTYETLLQQLERVEGNDEWAVHLYADRGVVRERISAAHPALRRLRDERGQARPGRAYFLERQLRDELETATREALVALAQTAFDRLAVFAVTGQMTSVEPDAGPTGETEILRACFLVPRASAERFAEEVRASADEAEGLRCDFSGPWPPYSFTAWDNEGAQ